MHYPLYDKQVLAERVKELIAEENEYQPLSDAAMCNICSDEGLKCSPTVIFNVRSCLGFGKVRERRQEYAAKRLKEKKNAK